MVDKTGLRKFQNKRGYKGGIGFTELRIIGFSLGILSIGLAIAYLGLYMHMSKKSAQTPTHVASPSGELR